jgi:glutathione S-transferase
MGTIPAIQDGDFTLSESDTLIEYLEDRFPEPSLLPGSAEERARQRFLSRFHDLWIEPYLRHTFVHGGPARLDPAALKADLDNYQERLRQLDTLIDPHPFMASETISIADCAFPGTFTFADQLLPYLGRESVYGPNLQAWRETVYSHPAVKASTDASGRETEQWIKRLPA